MVDAGKADADKTNSGKSDATKADTGKAKAWSETEKVDILIYMIATLNPVVEWTKLKTLPHGRTLTAVKNMYVREKTRVEKEQGEISGSSRSIPQS